MITFINVHFLHRFNSACKSHLSADPRIHCCDVHSLSNMLRYYSTLVLVITLQTILVIIICKWRQVKTFFTFKKKIKLYNSHLAGTLISSHISKSQIYTVVNGSDSLIASNWSWWTEEWNIESRLGGQHCVADQNILNFQMSLLFNHYLWLA